MKLLSFVTDEIAVNPTNLDAFMGVILPFAGVAESEPRVYHHYSKERVLTPPKNGKPFTPSGAVMSECTCTCADCVMGGHFLYMPSP